MNFVKFSDFSRENPRIVGHERVYQLYEPLDVNCSSAKAFPAPVLEWYIDGQMVKTFYTLSDLYLKILIKNIYILVLSI